jgi:hypothetical protein
MLRFEEHRVVSTMKGFKLIHRLYEDQCEPPTTNAPEQIELKEKPLSSSLQSPSDPDATYGHKGKGYEAQLTETCVEENAFQVVTAVSVNNANESDQQQLVPALEQTERTCGAAPEELHADAGYGSGENIVEAKVHGTDLKAPIGAKPSDNSVTLGDFTFDETGEKVLMCPTGEVPVAHEKGRGRPRLAIFASESCRGCALRSQCPTQTRQDRRVLPLPPRMQRWLADVRSR